MDPAYAAAYGTLARTHWWWAARDAIVLREIARIAGSGRRRVLDIGCGDGRLLDVLAARHDVEGIEPDAATGAPATPGRFPIHAAPFQAPLPVSGAFDVILMLDVLEHLPDPVTALGLAASLLAPRGSIVITVPALPALWTSHDTINHHCRRYTRRSLTREVAAAALRVERMRYFFHVLAVAKLAVRAMEALRGSRAGIPTVPPSSVNRAARMWSELEFGITGAAGRVLPGSSLLAVVARS